MKFIWNFWNSKFCGKVKNNSPWTRRKGKNGVKLCEQCQMKTERDREWVRERETKAKLKYVFVKAKCGICLAMLPKRRSHTGDEPIAKNCRTSFWASLQIEQWAAVQKADVNNWWDDSIGVDSLFEVSGTQQQPSHWLRSKHPFRCQICPMYCLYYPFDCLFDGASCRLMPKHTEYPITTDTIRNEIYEKAAAASFDGDSGLLSHFCCCSLVSSEI